MTVRNASGMAKLPHFRSLAMQYGLVAKDDCAKRGMIALTPGMSAVPQQIPYVIGRLSGIKIGSAAPFCNT